MQVRALREDERPWLGEHLELAWGSSAIVSRGRARDAAALPALVAVAQDALLGLATYAICGEECELVTLEAFERGRGVGGALLDAVAAEATRAGCARLRLVTTNDNTSALRFYQRRGLRLVALHAGAVERARALGPQIPLLGEDGIPVRDELELELPLR